MPNLIPYFPRTTSIPERIRCSLPGEILPTRSVRNSLSMARIWETFATDSFVRPVSRGERVTLPGASARRRLLVSGTHTTVATRLRFKASHWTTTTGRLKPGPEPSGSGRSAHQTSPWEIISKAFTRGYHSLRLSIRRAAADTNLSVGSSTSVQTRFIASVIASGAWRAMYSLTASPYRRLRDFLVRRARRSAPSNTSSGMETAVFIL